MVRISIVLHRGVCSARPGMVGCGLAATFPQLLAARCVTGVGSALQNTGAQLFLADISTTENRAQCLGTNQAFLSPPEPTPPPPPPTRGALACACACVCVWGGGGGGGW